MVSDREELPVDNRERLKVALVAWMRNLKIDSQHSSGKCKSTIVYVGETISCEDLREFLFRFIVVRSEQSVKECI